MKKLKEILKSYVASILFIFKLQDKCTEHTINLHKHTKYFTVQTYYTYTIVYTQ